MTAPVVGVATYAFRPGPDAAKTPLTEFSFPLGLPERLSGGCLGDLGRDDHLLVLPKSTYYLRRDLGIRAHVSLVIAEPRVVHRWHMTLLRVYHRRFFRVLTRDQRLLAQIPNGIFHNYTFSFLESPENVKTTKSREVSIIASGKRDQTGHRMRHSVIEQAQAEGLNVDVMGRGYKPFGPKEEGLAPYRYSVVIENSREPAYITEKLIDACICRTIPIYWGAPDVGEWLDARGMIICETEGEILNALRSLGDRDPADFAPYLEINRKKALELAEGDRRAAETLAQEIARSGA